MSPMRQVISLLLDLCYSLTEYDKEILLDGADHEEDCRCDTCRMWWVLWGSDGGYGPFTEEEIEAKAQEVGRKVGDGRAIITGDLTDGQSRNDG